MPERKKVLIITYYWPPASGPGVQRWLKFAKFLPEKGWEPIIITPKNGSYPNIDDSLLADIPTDLRIITTKTREPFSLYNRVTGQGKKGNTSTVGMMGLKKTRNPIKRLAKHIRANWFIPDARKGWVPYVVREVKNLIAQETIDAIITTGPPHSTHLAGLQIKRQTSIPWIADFRDPWVDIYYNSFLPRTEKTKQKDKALQDAVLSHTDLVITVSDGLAERLAQKAQQTATIYNGYDQADFQEDTSPPDSFFRLHYIGNLKANQNPTALWQAIAQLRNENEAFNHAFKLSLTGNIDPSVYSTIVKYGLESCSEIRPFAPHQQAVTQMQQAQLLLFIIPDTEGNQVILTGKLFEYLASRTPLLAIGPAAGNAAQILARCNRQPMLDYQDQTGITTQLQEVFSAFQGGKSLQHQGTEHTKYSREGLTQQLVTWLNRLT